MCNTLILSFLVLVENPISNKRMFKVVQVEYIYLYHMFMLCNSNSLLLDVLLQCYINILFMLQISGLGH